MTTKEAAIDLKNHFKLPEDYLSFANDNLPFTIEESLGTYYSIWNIESWSSLEQAAAPTETNKVTGPSFKTDQYEWNVLLYPKGNKPTESHVSLYLESASCQDQDICAQFILCMVDPTNPYRFLYQVCQHRFDRVEKDWGFTQFKEIKTLKGEKEELSDFQKSLPSAIAAAAAAVGPYIVEDRVQIISIVRLIKDPTGVLWHTFANYDSKAMTGYVGLHNQGATCYMNSLFQSLFFTNLYRKAVYQVPTENDDPTNSIVFAFQRLFYRLQFSDEAVSTEELTKSFGWNSLDSFMQHDIQEFNRLLQDNIEKKMRGTPAEDAIKQLFVGRMKSYINCMHVNFESSRSEDFYDIQLNVKGCKNLEESFRNYVLEETLEGDNKYMAEGQGLQDAKKGVIFESFPPVLHLQLKRFEYDMMKDSMIKINDRHEFPAEINLESYLLDTAKERSGDDLSYNYVLHGVLVHTGNLTGGHYFAFVRPTKENKWFKFDDDRVTPASLHEVFEDNFGGETQDIHPKFRKINRHTNAYMLVYIRELYQDQVLAEVTQDDIPTHLVERIKHEDEQMAADYRRRAEEHLFMTVYMITEKSFQANTGPDFIPQDADPNPEQDAILCVRRLLRNQTLDEFMVQYAEEHGIEPYQIRVWNVSDRQNGTVRLNQPFAFGECDLTLQELCTLSSRLPLLRVFIEEGIIDPNNGEPFFSNIELETLVFIKVFDPIAQTLRSLGSLAVYKKNTLLTMQDEFLETAQLAKGTEIDIYEEVTGDRLDLLDPNTTFDENEFIDGDIIVIQPTITYQQKAEFLQNCSCPDVVDFYYKLRHSFDVVFSPIQNPQNEQLQLRLRDDMTYNEIVFHLAACIRCPEPENIMLCLPNEFGNPSYINGRIKNIDGLRLSDMRQLIPRQLHTKLYYNVLPFCLAELESQKWIRICRVDNECINSGLIPKISKISDLYPLVRDGFKEKQEEGEETSMDVDKETIRIYQVAFDKVTKVFEPTEIVDASISDGEILFAEVLNEKEVNKGPDDYYISVFHYEKELTQTHSIPFKFLVIKNEEFKEFTKRLQAKSKLNDQRMEQVGINLITRFRIISLNQDNYPKLLEKYKQDTDIQLGLNHADPNARYTKAYAQGGIHFKGV